jgi:hypothetical protein
MDEDGTGQVCKVTSSTIATGTRVRCQLTCISTSTGFNQELLFHEITPPTYYGDYSGGDFSIRCGDFEDRIMSTTTDLYAFVSTDWSGGISSASARCRSLPSLLTVDETLAYDVPSSTFTLGAFDPMDEDGTVQVFKVTSSTIAAGTRVRCLMSCISTDSGFNQELLFHEVTLPTYYGDYSSGDFSIRCGDYAERVMSATTDLYAFVSTDWSGGISSASLICSLSPITTGPPMTPTTSPPTTSPPATPSPTTGPPPVTPPPTTASPRPPTPAPTPCPPTCIIIIADALRRNATFIGLGDDY